MFKLHIQVEMQQHKPEKNYSIYTGNYGMYFTVIQDFISSSLQSVRINIYRMFACDVL